MEYAQLAFGGEGEAGWKADEHRQGALGALRGRRRKKRTALCKTVHDLRVVHKVARFAERMAICESKPIPAELVGFGSDFGEMWKSKVVVKTNRSWRRKAAHTSGRGRHTPVRLLSG